MNKTPFSWDLYNKAPIVGIVRNLPLDTVLQIAKVYLEAGFYTIEVTMNTDGASEIIKNLRNKFPNLNVGAGTVCSMDDLNLALNAGSQFIVTPIIDENVIKKTVSNNTPIFPGAYSPTEIYKAWTLGASAVKIFPATQLGTQYVKDVLAPLDTIKLLPTGGVSKENIKSFFEAGAVGVGMGSSLLNKKLIQDNDFEGLKHHFISIKSEIKDFIQV
jgi:2-dehydro-3-deoxyphosphogluconate aldolase/(4S)-4-hydroxy-2-oxoglutarate aldolase